MKSVLKIAYASILVFVSSIAPLHAEEAPISRSFDESRQRARDLGWRDGMFYRTEIAAGNATNKLCQQLRHELLEQRKIKAQYQIARVVSRSWAHAVVALERAYESEHGTAVDSLTVGIRPDTYNHSYEDVQFMVRAYVRAMTTDAPLDEIVSERCSNPHQ